MAKKKKAKVAKMFTDAQLASVVGAFETLSRAMYKVAGCNDADKFKTMRTAEICASNIIAAKIVARSNVICKECIGRVPTYEQ